MELPLEGGFSIAKDYLDRWYFRRPDGIAVPQCGYRLEDTLDDDIDSNCTTLDKNPSAEGHPNKEGLPTIPPNVADRGPTGEGLPPLAIIVADRGPNKEGLPTLPLIVAERSPPAYQMLSEIGAKFRAGFRWNAGRGAGWLCWASESINPI